MRRRFVQCDVFSRVPGRGNGLAVVLDPEGLSNEAMQAFAAWTNLAETVFVSAPSDPAAADYAVRIFTTTRELPFAGHPTLGSCMAWLHAGGRPAEPGRVRQECGIGIVAIDTTGEVPAFFAPHTRIEPLAPERLEEALAALRIAPQEVVSSAVLTNGPVWEAIELRGAAAVLAADPSGARFDERRSIGLIGPHEPGGTADHEVRMFDIGAGVKEDPVTGSLNAALGCWFKAQGRLTGPYVAAQGTALGRLGRVHVEPRGEAVLVGGAVTILVEGTLDL